MKIEEAISHYKYGISHDIFSQPVTTYAQMAVEALERQVPKLVDMSHCNCGMALDNVWQYCPNCGQALKWGDAE